MSDDLLEKVEGWLNKQGFPLEFQVAQAFATGGFHTDQGAYVTDPIAGELREVDVIAWKEHQKSERRFRLSVLVECKWSIERPWVIFTSTRARPSPAASIAYLVGSSFAEAVLWYMAGDRNIQQLQRDVLSTRFGFGGRQALVEKQERELFYPAIQGVVAAATAHAHSLPPNASVTDVVRDLHVVIPMIVIEGRLFEAYLDGPELKVAEVTDTIVAWRGFGARSQPVFVRIVTAPQLPTHIERLANYADFIQYHAEPIAETLAPAVLKRDSRLLPAPPTARAPEVIAPFLLQGMV